MAPFRRLITGRGHLLGLSSLIFYANYCMTSVCGDIVQSSGRQGRTHPIPARPQVSVPLISRPVVQLTVGQDHSPCRSPGVEESSRRLPSFYILLLQFVI